MARKALIIVGVLVVIGIVIGVIVAVTSGGSSDASTSSGDNSENLKGNSTDSSVAGKVTPANVTDDSLLGPSGSGNTTSNASTIVEPTSDPETAVKAFSLLAIGDWGATTDKPGSCCNKYRKTANGSVELKTDYWAQINVAEILGQSAAAIAPLAVIGHGDNIYWNGAGPDDITYRMTTTFEDVYTQPGLQGVPWINVVGNHDLGGSDHICGDVDYQFRRCTSVSELLSYLDKKFTLQANYKSPKADRWKLTDHYYKETIEKNGVSVDIFNIDTNFADSHGVRQICCQCYGFVKDKHLPTAEDKALGNTCNDQKRGDALCAGGDVAMYDACSNMIEKWWDMSITGIKKDLAASKATWKIINSHYSPHFHMDEPKMKEWYAITKEHNVHLWMNGHTHGFNHDISKWGTHFYENGGGGGIQSETSGHPPEVAEKFVDHAWIAPGNPYGFFELHVSKDWLKTEFVTFDSKWVFSETKGEIVKGGYKKGHCWHVPVTGGTGRECKA